MSTKAKTVKEVLIATKYIIEHMDWHQGRKYRDNNGAPLLKSDPNFKKDLASVCLLGGLDLVEADSKLITRAEIILRDHCGGYPSGGIVAFNDYSGRTKEEVIKMLDEVIEATQ
jgi:hypothetical protein